MINVNTYTKAHDKGKGSGGTTVINNGGSNNSTIQNFKLINVETANINDLTAKNIKSNDASITYLSSDDGSITKITGKELNYDKAKIGSIEAGKIDADRIDANALNVRQAIIDALKSKEISTEYLTVTKQAHFFELVIDKLKSVGGQIILTPTNCVADYVVDVTDDIGSEDSYYRVYFKAKNSEGRAITNDWRLYDQAICQTFNNVVSGGTNQNKYYWRLVIGKNTNPVYVDLTYGMIYGGNGEPTWDHTLDLYEIKGAFKESTDPTYDNAINVIFDSTTPTTNASLTGENYAIQSLNGGINRLLTRNGLTSVGIQKKLNNMQQNIYGAQIYPNRYNYFFIKVRREKNNPVDVYFVLKDQTVAYFPFDTNNIIENTVYNVSWQYTIMKFDLSSLNNSVDTIIIYNKASSILEPCHYIDLSNNPGEYDTGNPEGLVENAPSNVPGVDDNICQLGYDYIRASLDPDNLDDDTKSRASAIIIAAYKTPDSELTAPSYAQYQYIHTFELSKYRCTYFDAKGGKIDGNITFGNSIEDRLKDISNGEVQYRLVTSLSNVPVTYVPSEDRFHLDVNNMGNSEDITILRQYKDSTYTSNNIYFDTMPEGKRLVIRFDYKFVGDVNHYALYLPLCTYTEREDENSEFYHYGYSRGSQFNIFGHSNPSLVQALVGGLAYIKDYFEKDLLDLSETCISLKTIDDNVELTTDHKEEITYDYNGTTITTYRMNYVTTYDSENNKRSFEDVVNYGLDKSEYGNEKDIYWGYAYKSRNYEGQLYTTDADSGRKSDSIFIPNNFGVIDKITLKGIKDTYEVLNEYVNVRYKQILTRYASIPASIAAAHPKLKVVEPVQGTDPAINSTTDNTITNTSIGKVYYTLPNSNYNDNNRIQSDVYWAEETDDSYFENNSNPMIWMSQAPVDNHGVIGTWTTPIKITGERGEVGASGVSQKFVYCTTVTVNETIEHPQAPHVLSGSNSVSVDGYNITNDSIPSQTYSFPFNVATDRGQTSFTNTSYSGAQFWSIYPTPIDNYNTTRWMSTSIYDEDTETWSAWSTPVIDSRWGENGRDGVSIEYIFYLASASDGDTVPKVFGCVNSSYDLQPTSGTARDVSNGTTFNYTDQNYSWVKDYNEIVPTSIGWSDNPRAVSSEYPIQYVSWRKSEYTSAGNKTWGRFSVPVVWNAYAGLGLDGKDGVKGDSTKIIYIKLTYDPGTLAQYTGYIPGEWSTTMPSLSQTEKMAGWHIYMSQCTITYGANNAETWSAWSDPLQLDGPEGQAGEDVQYIYSYSNKFIPSNDFTLGSDYIISYLESIYDDENFQPDEFYNTNFAKDDYEPVGWSLSPLDISYETPDIYVSTRRLSYNLKQSLARNYRAAGKTNNREKAYNVRHWTEYSTPVRFSHFGDQGIDGCGIEYIYRISDHYPLTSAEEPRKIDDPLPNDYNNAGHVPNGWYNSPLSVSSTNRYLLMSQRKQTVTTDANGMRVITWGIWSAPMLWTTFSSVGIDGGYHKFIYAILENDYNGGNPTFTSAQEIANDTTWSLDVPDTSSMNYLTHAVYMSNCFVTYDSSGNESFGAWSDPIRISGVVGPQGETGPQGSTGPQGLTGPQGPIGRDGESVEFIYKLTNSESTSSLGLLPYQITIPSFDSHGQTKTDDMFIPDGWTDHPQGVDQSHRYEWVCVRQKRLSYDNQGNEIFGWTDWGNPSIWSKYGENGLDGDGLEYVFLRTAANVTVDNINWLNYVDTNNKTYEQGGFLPYSTINGTQVQWTDQPSGINYQYPLEWVSIRKWTNSAWEGFSTPKIWSYRGQDGDGFEYIYYRTDADEAPSTPTSNTTVWENDAANLPEGNVWTNDPRGVNITYKEEYVSVRHREANNEWGAYSTPSLWGRYTAKGLDGRSLQVAYKVSGSKPNAPTNQATGTTSNGITTWSGDWTTEMPSSGYDGINTFVWMTQRFIESDGSYSDWTPVIRISGEKGEPGADGGEIEFLYCRTKEQTDASSFTVPSNSNEHWDDTDYGKDTTTGLTSSAGDTTWSDNPRGLTGSDGLRYEYMICRTKNAGSTFGNFTQPVIWSAWGEKGSDGDGFEYAFCRIATTDPIPTIDGNTIIFDNNDPNLADSFNWTNNPRGVNENYPEEYVSVRHKTSRTNNQWSNWSTPALWARFSAKGSDGSHWVYAYRKDYITATVDAPTAGSTIQNISGTWSTEQTQLTEAEKNAGKAIWMTQCEVDGLDNYGTWTTPIIISGINGKDGKDGTDGEDGYDGIDGTCIEYIYKNVGSSSFTNGTYNGTHPKNITQKDSSSTGNTKADDDFIPNGWSDHPTGVTETNKFELVSQRIKKHRTVNGEDVLGWGDFTDPVIWSKWGEKGMDGDGFEYIYRRTSESNDLSGSNPTPSNWSSSSTYQQNEYLPTNWTDNPSGIEDDTDKRVEWVCVRKKENGKWGRFSDPVVWARKGADGDGYEYVYKLTNTETDLSNVQLHPNNYLTNTNYQNNDEYCSFLADAGHTGWTDDPQGVDASNSNKHVEWVSVRKRKNGIWQEFSAPSIWSRYTTKGSDGRSLQVAYKLWNGSGSLGKPNSGAGTYITSGGYYEYGNSWYSIYMSNWTDIGTTNHVYMTQRYYDNGDYTNWSTPIRITGYNGEPGADGKDGTNGGEIEFLYCRTKSSTDTPSITGTSNYTDNGNTYTWDGQDYGVGKSTNLSNNSNGDKGDTKWSDSPRGVTSTLKYEWVIVREKPAGGTFGSFTTPVIWSSWGEKGTDGDGYEYVYVLTPATVDLSATYSDTHPNNIWDDKPYNNKTKADDEYLPYSIYRPSSGGTNTTYRWTDDPQGVSADSDKQREWVSSRKKTNGTWGSFSRPALWSKWSEKGNAGDSLQIAYKIAESEPNTPTNGAPGSTSNGITTWSGNWSTKFPTSGYDSTTNFIWMTQRFIQDNGDNYGYTNWSTPIRVNGATGPKGDPGSDGGDIEFLYARSKQTRPTKPTKTSQNETYQYNLHTYKWNDADWGVGQTTGNNDNTKGDTVWSDNPQGVDDTFIFEWVTQRTKHAGGNWSSFTTPVVWSKYGEKGQDGDGYEYIFKRTTKSTSYVSAPYSNNTDGDVPYGWTDNPQGVTSTSDQQKEWVSKRKKTSGGKWSNWSTPAIWAVWAEDGTDGKDGKNGKNGSYYEYGYQVNNNSTAPTLTSSERSSSSLPNGWYTNAPSLTQSNPYLWRIQRLVTYNSSNEQNSNIYWSSPASLIGKWAKDGNDGGTGPQGPPGTDGKDGGAVYALVARKSKCGVYINTDSSTNTSVPFRLETDFEFSVTKIDGNGASTMSQSDLSGFTVIYYTYKQDNTSTSETLYPNSGKFVQTTTGRDNYYQPNMSQSIVRYEFRLKKGSTVVDTVSYDVNVVPGALQQKTDSSISDFIQKKGVAVKTSDNGTTTKSITEWFEYMTKTAKDYLQTYGKTYLNTLITSYNYQSATAMGAYIKVADMKTCGIDINYDPSHNTGTVTLYGDKVKFKKTDKTDTFAFFDSNGFLNVGKADGYGVKLYGSDKEGAVVGYNNGTQTFRLRSSGISGVGSRLELGSEGNSYMSESTVCVGGQSGIKLDTASRDDTKFVQVGNTCYFGCGTNINYIDFGFYNNTHGVVSSNSSGYTASWNSDTQKVTNVGNIGGGLILNNILKSGTTYVLPDNPKTGLSFIIGKNTRIVSKTKIIAADGADRTLIVSKSAMILIYDGSQWLTIGEYGYNGDNNNNHF